METIVAEDSVLAEYLEGSGNKSSHGSPNPSPPESPSANVPSFAPRGPPRVRKRPEEIKIVDRRGNKRKVLRARVQDALFDVLQLRPGAADNERFLEQFRYHIVTSGLLKENAIHPASAPLAPPSSNAADASQASLLVDVAFTSQGAAATAAGSFIFVLLLKWARPTGNGLQIGRIVVACLVMIVLGALGYAHVSRQMQRSLRRQAVDALETAISNVHAFEKSANSALVLVQEVELVSRGYRLSQPLPPISRLEETAQSRRCVRLRKYLQKALSANVPTFSDTYTTLKAYVDEDELDKYLDVYEVATHDIHEASEGIIKADLEELESLKLLRAHYYRLTTLRRLVFCALLVMKADGTRDDVIHWRSTISLLHDLATTTCDHCTTLSNILREESDFHPQTPKHCASTPARDRLRTQVRKISALSSGIRGLQAKMQLLREESHTTLETDDSPPDEKGVEQLAATLLQQYDSIGADLRQLMTAWETGRASLAATVERNHERRISLASSSGFRSPVSSLGGLTAVDESSLDPSDALRKLTGEDLTGRVSPATLSLHAHSDTDDELVFEAVALPPPRQRHSLYAGLPREERLEKMREERETQRLARDRRDHRLHMMKELESVIRLRPLADIPRRGSSGRITSM